MPYTIACADAGMHRPGPLHQQALVQAAHGALGPVGANGNQPQQGVKVKNVNDMMSIFFGKSYRNAWVNEIFMINISQQKSKK